METKRFANSWRLIASAIFGGAVSFALTQTFFDFEARTNADRLYLFFIPALALSVCCWYGLPFLRKSLADSSTPARGLIFAWAGLSILLTFFVTQSSIFSLFLLLVIFLLLTIPAAPSIQNIIEAGGRRRIFGAWLFAFIASSLLIGFLDNFYSSPIEIVLLTLLSQSVFGAGGYFLMGRLRRVTNQRLSDALTHGALFLLLAGFIIWGFQTSRIVSLFPISYFVLNDNSGAVFLFASLLALPWQGWLHLRLKFSGFYNRVKHTKMYAYISANLAGISLALGFFILYLILASVINDPHFDVDDIFFDADGMNYRIRLTTDNWRDFYGRSVHPFMILLFKPPVDLIAFFLKGNKLWGAYVFVALGGAACVYLAWMFIKMATGNSIYASLIAMLLGITASHLVFGSLLESYIFLAASLLLFYVLLLNDKPLPPLIAASLVTMGITYTNFAQNVIALFAARPNIKQIFRFVVSGIVFLVLLTLLNNLLYPDSNPLFFIPSTLQAEQQNLFPLNSLRLQALTRAFFFHNVIAPTPIFYDKDIPFIQFRFFKPEINEISQYTLPSQNVAAWMWFGLLILAAALFLLNLKKNPYLKLSIGLMGCMALNLALHLCYGKELFLYTPNWTYALILFLGLAWRNLHDRKWFQTVLLFLIALLVWNNGILIQTILEVLAEQA